MSQNVPFPSILRPFSAVLLAVLLIAAVGCQQPAEEGMVAPAEETATTAPEPEAAEAEVYVANLSAVNEDLTGAIDGTAGIRVEGGQVMLSLEAEGVPAGMMHLQHTHGLTDGGTATCPGPDADGNGDGVVDLVEAEASTGTTMIPFHDNPTSMEIQAQTYPQAGEDGTLDYEQTVDLEALRQAFQGKFAGQELAWDRRVVMVHGVPRDADLPGTAQSLPDVPAHVTLPIACGELEVR